MSQEKVNQYKESKKNRGLERSFKMSIPEDVYDCLEKEFDESGEE